MHVDGLMDHEMLLLLWFGTLISYAQLNICIASSSLRPCDFWYSSSRCYVTITRMSEIIVIVSCSWRLPEQESYGLN